MRTFVLPSLIATLTLGAGAVRAQDAPAAPAQPPAAPTTAPPPAGVPQPPAAVTTPATGRTAPSKNSYFMFGDFGAMMGDALPSALKNKIDLEANNMPVVDAIKSVLDSAKMPYEIAPEATSDAKVTMTLKGVPAYYALMMLSREAKLAWVFEKKDDKEKVRIVKPMPGRGNQVWVASPNVSIAMPRLSVGGQYASRVATESAIAAAGKGYSALTIGHSALLPDTRVKLDVRNADIRDTLKKVLEQAKLDYALEEDVPEDVKRSFTFENVPVATALDVVCRSAEIGWRAELREKKPFIRIGKKYAHMGLFSVSANGTGVDSFANFYDTFDDDPVGPAVRTTVSGPGRGPMITERRAVFTCPHCGAKATILVRTDRVKSGTRNRAAVEAEEKEKEKQAQAQAWKFCPVCGKAIEGRSQLRIDDCNNSLISAHVMTALAPLPPMSAMDTLIPCPSLLPDATPASGYLGLFDETEFAPVTLPLSEDDEDDDFLFGLLDDLG